MTLSRQSLQSVRLKLLIFFLKYFFLADDVTSYTASILYAGHAASLLGQILIRNDGNYLPVDFNILLLSETSRLTPKPTQPHTQRYQTTFSGVKRRKHDNLSPLSNADVKNEWSYSFTPPVRLHGMDGKLPFLYNFPTTFRKLASPLAYCRSQ